MLSLLIFGWLLLCFSWEEHHFLNQPSVLDSAPFLGLSYLSHLFQKKDQPGSESRVWVHSSRLLHLHRFCVRSAVSEAMLGGFSNND